MTSIRSIAWGLLPGLLVWWSAAFAFAEEPTLLQLGELHHLAEDDPEFELVQYSTSTQPFDTGANPLGAGGSSIQPLDVTGGGLTPGQETTSALIDGLGLGSTPGVDVLTRSQIAPSGNIDSGQALSNSSDIQTVATQRRSQVSFDPHIRGYRFGQIYTQADGELFLPVRQDLDSMLSKIDPGLISNMAVVPGPYASRYGPGFAFIDINTLDTPRHQNGFENHNRFGLTVKGNGGQVYFRDFLSGGDSDSGYRIGYGNRTGSDYRAGNGMKIPSSYRARTSTLQLGYDLSPNDTMEFRYNRLDQSDTEYYLQMFDVSSLLTDSFNVKYVISDPNSSSRVLMNAWWNGTNMNGNNQNASKAIITNRIVGALQADDIANGINPGDPDFTTGFNASTYGHLNSAGTRVAKIMGEKDDLQLRTGADVRLVQQALRENFQETNNLDAVILQNSTFMNHSTLIDPGVFTEVDLPWASYMNTTIGGRLDWVQTRTRGAPPIVQVNSPDPDAVSQNDVLYSLYMGNELEMNQYWTARSGLGYSQRVPDLVNRYAGGIFMGLTQNGLNRIVGRLDLAKERVWQADMALQGDWDVARCRASAFYSWIGNYNTYSVAGINDPTGAQVLFAHNTQLATLTGFELYGEANLSQYWTAFASAFYVQGTDQTLGVPLWGIYPFDSRFGFRLVDPINSQWGGEMAARVVAQQNRLGQLLIDGTPGDTRAVEQRTGGFTTVYMRGYYNMRPGMQLTGGVDNLFNKLYIEHLDLRVQASGTSPAAFAYSPGTTGYLGIEWTY